MGQLTLNITEESDVKIIASSAFNFRIELVLQIGHDDLNDVFEISKDIDTSNRLLLQVFFSPKFFPATPAGTGNFPLVGF